MNEAETDEGARRGYDELEFGSDLDAEVTDAFAEGAALETEDFDHRLLLSRVGMALFDEGETLRIGKFEVVRHLDEGGMGQVYLCRDETLDRAVAVKCVRGFESEVAQERLRREAVALARLSHDNVVQVYDSGDHEGRVYVAMEFVEGQTLRDWMAEDHTHDAILDLFRAAGRGLAAAHAKGLVHRDFKPENVLIDRDGKPKVADFGLVRQDGDASVEPHELPLAFANRRELTAAGALIGTRQYMPLEQILGETVGPRSDQFSFCMTLYEALWGELPFPYTSFEDRTEALRSDPPKTPGTHHELYRVIQRGLARDPEQRWPSMDALLRALERARHRRQRLAWAGVIGLGVGLVLAAAPMLWPPSVDACPAVASQLDEVWTGEIADSLDVQLGSLDAPHVDRSRELLRSGLDAWSEAWTAERTETCHALRGAARDPGRLAEATARDACLTRQTREVSTLVAELAEGDADTLAQAVIAVSALPAPSSCADASPAPEPLSPKIAAEVHELRGELARVHQLRLLGERERALTAAAAIETQARALGYEPLLARVLAERAKIEDEAGAAQRADALYLEAIKLAKKGRAEALEAELVLERAQLSVFDLASPKLEAAEARYEWLESYLESSPDDPQLLAGVAHGRGRLAQLRGDHLEAADHYRAAIDLVGPGAAELPAYYDLLSQVVAEPHTRSAHSRQAYELAAALWGAKHPRTATYMRDYGIILDEEMGELETGRELRAQAAELLAGSGAPRDRANAEYERAKQAIDREDWEAARDHAQTQAKVQDEFLPPGDPDRGEPQLLLMAIESGSGQSDAAFEHAQEALRLFETDPARRAAPQLLGLRIYLANVLMSRDELDAAREQAEAVLEVAPDSGEAALARLRLAEVAVRGGEPASAAEHLDACGPRLAELAELAEFGDEELVYELLRALVNLRLDPPRPVDEIALRGARERHRKLDQDMAGWLEQLEIVDEERRALGYEEI